MKKVVFVMLFIASVLGSCQEKKEGLQTFDPAFTHTVYFWLNEPDNAAHRLKFETSLKKFLNASKYTKTNFIGTPPKAIREVVDDSFTYTLVVTFESAEAQEGYQEEEVHLQFIEECKSLWKKVVVYDAVGI